LKFHKSEEKQKEKKKGKKIDESGSLFSLPCFRKKGIIKMQLDRERKNTEKAR